MNLDPPPPMPPLQVNQQAADPAPQQIFESPQGPVLEAIGNNRGLVAICAVVFCLIGIAAGFTRQPVYTSSATLQVGQVNPNSPGFFGYVQSASGLATAFSRAIAAEPVLESVEQKLKLPSAEAISRLSS